MNEQTNNEQIINEYCNKVANDVIIHNNYESLQPLLQAFITAYIKKQASNLFKKSKPITDEVGDKNNA